MLAINSDADRNSTQWYAAQAGVFACPALVSYDRGPKNSCATEFRALSQSNSLAPVSGPILLQEVEHSC